MLPHITGQDCAFVVNDRIVGVVPAFNRQRPVGVLHQPSPSAAEMGDGGLSKFLLKAVEIDAGFFDCVGHPAAWFTSPIWPQALPIKAMVEMLGGIVENGTLTCFL